MKKHEINILMTGAGAPGAAGILKCLRREPSFRVVTADANEDVVGRYLSDDFVKIPRGDHPDFIPAVLDACRKKNIHVLLPLVTAELIPLARNYREFALAGTQLMLSPAESLEIANNKCRLYEFLQWRSVDVPDFRIIEELSQLEKALNELGYPEKKLTIKPSVSNGSRGFRVIDGQVDEFDLFFNQKPGDTRITLSELMRILSSRPIPEMLVSEYLPGEEYSVDCLAKEGHLLLALPRLRKKMINGISVEGAFVRDDSIMDYCRLIISELHLHGNIGIQVKRSAGGKFLILEINPRVQGTISAGLGAGINLPVLAIRSQLGLPVTDDDMQVKWGTKFARYWEEVFY
jgi:carbamoyl-phosphate synthase large subunit